MCSLWFVLILYKMSYLHKTDRKGGQRCSFHKEKHAEVKLVQCVKSYGDARNFGSVLFWRLLISAAEAEIKSEICWNLFSHNLLKKVGNGFDLLLYIFVDNDFTLFLFELWKKTVLEI